MTHDSDDIAPQNQVRVVRMGDQRLEREHIRRALLDEVARGLEDVREGRVASAQRVLARYRAKRGK